MGTASLTHTLAGDIDSRSENYVNTANLSISDFTVITYDLTATWLTNVLTEASFVIISNTGSNELVWRIGDGTDYWRMELAAGQYVAFPLSYYQEFMTTQVATQKGLSLYSALGTTVEVIALL